MTEELVGWLSEHFFSMSVVTVALSTFFLMFLNSSIQTPPSEVICTAAGIYAAGTGHGTLSLIIVSVVGNFLGTSIWFYWGRVHRERALAGWVSLPDRVVEFLGRRSSSYYISKFEEHGWVPVFSLRMFPVVRSIVSYPAGRSSLAFREFALASFFGIGLWCAIWVNVGSFFGSLIDSTAVFVFSISFAVLFWIGFAVFHGKRKAR